MTRRRKLWTDYPELTDRDWLLNQLRARKTNREIGDLIGVSPETVYKALRHHNLTRPQYVSNNPELNDKLSKK